VEMMAAELVPIDNNQVQLLFSENYPTAFQIQCNSDPYSNEITVFLKSYS